MARSTTTISTTGRSSRQSCCAAVRLPPTALDYDLIAEEIEDLGRSELHACQSLCEHIIEHLLKIEYSGLTEPADHWRREIAEWRVQLERKRTRSIIAKLDLPNGIAWL